MRGGSTPTPFIARGEDGTTAGDVPSPRPRTGNKNIEPKVEGRSAILEEREVSGPRGGTAGGGNSPSPGRGDTGILGKTGTPALNVSEWSLTSCDDVDDGAVSRQQVTYAIFLNRTQHLESPPASEGNTSAEVQHKYGVGGERHLCPSLISKRLWAWLKCARAE